MGIYLNSKAAFTLYQNETKKPYFVDKSLMLETYPFRIKNWWIVLMRCCEK